MIWSASLFLTLAGPPPDPVAERVRVAIASAWRVAPTGLVLVWGPIASAVEFPDTAGFRLLGTGRDGRFVVVIRAQGARDIAVTLRAGRHDSVWVAARPLPAGAIIMAEDVKRVPEPVWGPPSSALDSPIGLEVRRTLAVGDRVMAPAVAAPMVIAPGDAVEFVWDGGPIRVSRGAIAQTRARRGETVWASSSAGERIQGVALGPGRARLVPKGRVR